MPGEISASTLGFDVIFVVDFCSNLILHCLAWLHSTDAQSICVSEDKNEALENGQEIKFCVTYKHLGVEITNEGTLDTAIKERNLLENKVVTVLNGTLWDRNIDSNNKY